MLANTPAGPSWFIVERGAPGFTQGKPENKHGIRTSNTAALSFTDVYVDADRLVGGVEGQGLLQAQAVFGYTRLMVAAFGLGAGWAALDRAIPYSAKRIQAGSPLSEKQGYTHKLIVPNVVRLEAGRAYIEETAERIDAGEGSLNTEGAIAKYMSTEAGNAAAEASIQALGGYGYTHEYMVEKISRDVRITTIYEGTSEIMEMTISRDRWQLHLKTRGRHYHERAREFEALDARHPDRRRRLRRAGAACPGRSDGAGAGGPADPVPAHSAAAGRMDRVCRVRRQPGAPRGAAWPKDGSTRRPTSDSIRRPWRRSRASSRAKRRSRSPRKVCGGSSAPWPASAAGGASEAAAFEAALNLSAIHRAQVGLLADMDFVADVLYGRAAKAVGARRLEPHPGIPRLSLRSHRHAGHSLSSDRDRRGGRRSARCAERNGLLEEHHRRALQHHRSHTGPLGSGPLL